ncbi:MAG: 4-(cytidine 5'-diphospho)-2-C-methyl-D-erythritol kinase [Verrucomicrobiota bacterium]
MMVSAPAKVNLSLRVVGKREDGFHEIETRMAPLTLCDELLFERRDEGGLAFTCTDSELPTDESNLVVRSVRQLERHTGKMLDVSIQLTKRIPHGAGLAGGSSDAASTLQGLNDLFELGISREDLRGLAAEIGSDIPFFLYERVCDCRGRGEFVEPVTFPHTLSLMLVKPWFGIPTPWAYQRWKESREIPGVEYETQEQAWGEMQNSLERPVFEKYLVLADLKNWLRERVEVEGALMSGSGSTTFAILAPEAGTESLERDLRSEFGKELWIAFCETRSG